MYFNPPREPDRLLLTFDEAAKSLACCAKTIANMVKKGDLKVVRLGPSRRAVRICVDDLREYIEREKRGGT